MTEIKQIYKCNICGNIVEVLHAGVGELVCCGKPMDLLIEKNNDEGLEKHIPVIGKFFDADSDETRNAVVIGEVLHPMEPAHHIEWIEVIYDGSSVKKFLNPSDAPKMLFDFNNIDPEKVKLRAYCNIHGLWSNK